MKVLFISANTERINMPALPLGLGCVATAARKAGHKARLLDLMDATDTGRIVKEAIWDLKPDVIGVSVRNIDNQSMENNRFLLDEVKEVISYCRSFSDAPIVLGGAGYSISPVAALEYLKADMGIRGEGEGVFVELLDRLQKGAVLSGVPGLYLRDGGLQGERIFVDDLDSLPFPDVDLWRTSYADDPDFWMPFQTRRGCSMRCNYCSTAAIEGTRLRKRSPKAVADGIARYFEAGFKRFYFTDNNFNIPASYAAEICRSLIDKGLDISWRCIVYPVRLDEVLGRYMARAGCREVSLGFESGNECVLNVMNKRFKPADVRQASEVFLEHGIRRMGFLLLGGPGETRESVKESLSFADSLKLDMLKISIGIRIYPDTALAKRAVEDGLLAADDDLLFPRFYIIKDLERWLRETVGSWMADRPNWVM